MEDVLSNVSECNNVVFPRVLQKCGSDVIVPLKSVGDVCGDMDQVSSKSQFNSVQCTMQQPPALHKHLNNML